MEQAGRLCGPVRPAGPPRPGGIQRLRPLADASTVDEPEPYGGGDPCPMVGNEAARVYAVIGGRVESPEAREQQGELLRDHPVSRVAKSHAGD